MWKVCNVEKFVMFLKVKGKSLCAFLGGDSGFIYVSHFPLSGQLFYPLVSATLTNLHPQLSVCDLASF